ISWYARGIHISRDGHFMVRDGPWAGNIRQLGVAFYDRGKLVTWFTIDDLVSDKSQLARTVSHFFWRAGAGVLRSNIYELHTVSSDRLRFDIERGDLISAETTVPAHISGTFIGGRKDRHVTQLVACGSALSLILGAPTRTTALLGEIDKEKDGHPIVQFVSIPLDQVSMMKRIDEVDARQWQVHFRTGETIALRLGELDSLCAASPTGRESIALGEYYQVNIRIEARQGYKNRKDIAAINERARTEADDHRRN
ncbi:MAG: hypothetical protein AAF493_30270, partial [Pseudomonadota bacterium]